MSGQDQGRVELIAFEIGGHDFCIDIAAVREIRGWTPASPLPHAPEHVLGVINLRGAVMPVLDVRCRLGLGRTEPSSRHVIIVVQDDDRLAGLLVDAVQETFVVDASLFQPPPEMAAGASALVEAILPRENRLLSQLVVGSLLPAAQAQAQAA